MTTQTESARRTRGGEQREAAAGPSTFTVTYEGVEREVAILLPTSYAQDTPMPLVFALHGGSGDASVMYSEEKRIGAHAERDGFIAVFPNGLPKPDRPDSRNYYWGDPVNHGYMIFLMDELTARYTVDTGRIYLVGFSGGAKLIYGLASDSATSARIAASDSATSARIAAIGTVAGETGGKQLEPPEAPWAMIDPSVSGGRPMPAFLVQGAKDAHLPIDGGFDDEGEKIVVGFETKVALWRHFAGARAETPFAATELPTAATVRQWTNAETGHAVVAVVADNLAHRWPEWDLMGELWRFFERMPRREPMPEA